MTYNFDPERWYDNERAAIDRRRRQLSEQEYLRQLADLDRRYEDMLDRLDGTYRLPGG
ncbi:MAG: hypothetical protein K9L59_07610 [Desulfobacterales bacterium]|nr:hypothetical protein [Desulfobacterales bacterium]MCF8079389.1 hypothetical protein [Desulfobacterales bacterium]